MQITILVFLSLFLVSACSLERSIYPPIDAALRRCENSAPLAQHGVIFRAAAIELLNEVENKFQKGVCISELKNAPTTTYGQSEVAEDGTPLVRMRAALDPEEQERTITHELYHLKFRADGFPTIAWTLTEAVDYPLLRHISEQVFNGIEHYMFFPSIRKMAIDPSARFKASTIAGDYKVLKQESIYAAIYYYRSMLLIDDKQLLSQIRTWYEDHGLLESKRKGEEMAAIVKNRSPRTPDELLATQIDLVQTISHLPDIYEFRGSSEAKRGNLKIRLTLIHVRRN